MNTTETKTIDSGIVPPREGRLDKVPVIIGRILNAESLAANWRKIRE
jgi:hypothetical protein